MAVPCGCGGASITVEGEGLICVRQEGARPTRYIVSICSESGDACEAIRQCIVDALGPGLTYDEATGQIQVCLSDDAGNTLHFGGDQCLKNLDGVQPVPPLCGQTIDDLPETGVVGATSVAGLHYPYSSPYGVAYCLANRVDIIHFQVGGTADGVAVVTDNWNQRVEQDNTSVFVGQEVRQMNASAVNSAWSYAGNPDDPESVNLPETPRPTPEERGGGWWGWLAQNYYQPLAEDFLRMIEAKSVAWLSCVTNPESPYGEEHHVPSAIRVVLQQCAQEWALIGVAQIPNAQTVLNAGITPILNPDGLQPITWGTTVLPYPVGDVTGAGVEWIALSDHYADSVFEAYRDAGVNVLMLGNSRHSTKARVNALGIRGAMAFDPVYYVWDDRGADIRPEWDPWEHRRPSLGMLTHETDVPHVIAKDVRGYAEAAEQGLILPAGFGKGLVRPTVLAPGSPIADPTDYTLEWDAKWLTLAASASRAKMGILFGAETDRNTLAWEPDPDVNPNGYPEGQQTLYRAWVRQNGELGLAKWDGPNPDGNFVVLATTSTPSITVDEWSSYTVRVQGSTITLTRNLGGQEWSVVAEDSQYRGPYWFIEKEETFGGDPDPDRRFAGKFRNIGVYQGAPGVAGSDVVAAAYASRGGA